MPVRVVASGGSPVRIVTSGGDPVRIVTHGISDPVRIIGGGLGPDAPTFVSGEVGTVDASTVVVTFSTDITAPCGDCSLGFTVLVNGVLDAITACVIVGGNTVQLTLTNPVVFGDTVTVSYDSTVGCIMESTGVTDLATFPAQAVTNNVAGNGLLNNLIAFWPGNEVNGNALDMHTNGLTLTDVNTVTSAVGKVYALARQYTAGTSECHNRLGDDALLSTGDIDFTLAAWMYTDTQVLDMWCASKWQAVAGARGYGIRYVVATDRIGFIVRNAADATNVEAVANTYGAVPNATWIFVVGWHDSVADTVNIQVNDGAVDPVALAGGCLNDTSKFTIGAPSDTVGLYWNGRIGPTMFWKSNAGLGGVLTAAQRTTLYNAGSGLPYASFTV